MHRNLKTNVQKCSTITVCLTVTEKMFVLPACCFLSSLQSTADSLWQKKIKNLEFPSHVLCMTDSSLATLHLSIMQTRMLAYTHIHTHTQKMNGCMAYSHLAHTHSNRENRGGGVTGEERIEMSQERRMIQHVREELASVALYASGVWWDYWVAPPSLLALSCVVLKRLTTPLSLPIMTG